MEAELKIRLQYTLEGIFCHMKIMQKYHNFLKVLCLIAELLFVSKSKLQLHENQELPKRKHGFLINT